MKTGTDPREAIARRVSQEMKDGFYVNLRIGMLGVGPYTVEGQEDPDLINAGRRL